MKIQYFSDTDTLYIELRNSEIAQTQDLDDNTLIDLDGSGQIVGITIEHAKTRANLPEIELTGV